MGWASSDEVRFDLGPLFQGQMRVAKLKVLIIPVNNLQFSYFWLPSSKMLFTFKIMLVVLFRSIHLASDHKCILGLFLLLFIANIVYLVL